MCTAVHLLKCFKSCNALSTGVHAHSCHTALTVLLNFSRGHLHWFDMCGKSILLTTSRRRLFSWFLFGCVNNRDPGGGKRGGEGGGDGTSAHAHVCMHCYADTQTTPTGSTLNMYERVYIHVYCMYVCMYVCITHTCTHARSHTYTNFSHYQ